MDAVSRFVINKAKSQAQKLVPVVVQSLSELQTPLLDEDKLF
jgi:hypothetical protein